MIAKYVAWIERQRNPGSCGRCSGCRFAPSGLRESRLSRWEEDDASTKTPDRGAGRVRDRPGGHRAAGARPGQDLRAQAVPLGSADASAAESDGGLGLFDREGVERDDQVQDL